jgi:hypothetical protein
VVPWSDGRMKSLNEVGLCWECLSEDVIPRAPAASGKRGPSPATQGFRGKYCGINMRSACCGPPSSNNILPSQNLILWQSTALGVLEPTAMRDVWGPQRPGAWQPESVRVDLARVLGQTSTETHSLDLAQGWKPRDQCSPQVAGVRRDLGCRWRRCRPWRVLAYLGKQHKCRSP